MHNSGKVQPNAEDFTLIKRERGLPAGETEQAEHYRLAQAAKLMRLSQLSLPVPATAVESLPGRYKTAVHEAGHAVAALLLDLRFNRATVIAEADNEGSVDMDNPLLGWERGDGPRRTALEAWVKSLYAGWAAEMLVLGQADAPWYTDFDSAEYWIAESGLGVRGARYVGDEAYDRYAGRLRAAALDLLRPHTAIIEAVGRELAKRDTLTIAEIEAIVASPGSSYVR